MDSSWKHKNRCGIGEGVGDSCKCVFGSRSALHTTNAYAFAVGNEAVTVGHVDQGSLGPSHNRPDASSRTGLNKAVCRKTEKNLHSFGF